MAHGGPRNGAGRKPGAATKFNQAAREKAAEGGIMPLDYMLSVLRDENQPREVRMDAAKASAPFTHARLESIKHSGDPANPLQTVTRIERTIIDPIQDVADSDAESIQTTH